MNFFIKVIGVCLLFSRLISYSQNIDKGFADEFSQDNGHWYTGKNEKGEFKIENGYYYISNIKNVSRCLYQKKFTLSGRYNFSVEVKIKHVGGPTNKGFGIAYQYKDWDNKCLALISGNQYAKVSCKVNNKFANLYKPKENSFINKTNEWNILKVIVNDGNITFSANGQKIFSGEQPAILNNAKLGVFVGKEQNVILDYMKVEIHEKAKEKGGSETWSYKVDDNQKQSSRVKLSYDYCGHSSYPNMKGQGYVLGNASKYVFGKLDDDNNAAYAYKNVRKDRSSSYKYHSNVDAVIKLSNKTEKTGNYSRSVAPVPISYTMSNKVYKAHIVARYLGNVTIGYKHNVEILQSKALNNKKLRAEGLVEVKKNLVASIWKDPSLMYGSLYLSLWNIDSDEHYLHKLPEKVSGKAFIQKDNNNQLAVAYKAYDNGTYNGFKVVSIDPIQSLSNNLFVINSKNCKKHSKYYTLEDLLVDSKNRVALAIHANLKESIGYGRLSVLQLNSDFSDYKIKNIDFVTPSNWSRENCDNLTSKKLDKLYIIKNDYVTENFMKIAENPYDKSYIVLTRLQFNEITYLENDTHNKRHYTDNPVLISIDSENIGPFSWDFIPTAKDQDSHQKISDLSTSLGRRFGFESFTTEYDEEDNQVIVYFLEYPMDESIMDDGQSHIWFAKFDIVK